MRWPKIIEVEDAVVPAIAYEQDGKMIVEVDATLKGKGRAAAIVSAVRSHKRGFGSVVLLPIALYAWEPIKNATRNHPGAALASTAAGVGLLATAIALPLKDGSRMPGAAPLRTVTASAPAPPTPTWTAPTRWYSPTPQGTPHVTTPATTRPSIREPAPEVTAPITPHLTPGRTRTPAGPEAENGGPRPTRSIQQERPTLVNAPAVTTPPLSAGTDEADPPPLVTSDPTVTASVGRDCLLEVDLDPLLDACVG